jgi:hypothetical protein
LAPRELSIGRGVMAVPFDQEDMGAGLASEAGGGSAAVAGGALDSSALLWIGSGGLAGDAIGGSTGTGT